jgi:hypothetical protein
MITRLHRSEVSHQIGRVVRAQGVAVSRKAIEQHLGYPLAEANVDELRGIIAALSAVVGAPAREESP